MTRWTPEYLAELEEIYGYAPPEKRLPTPKPRRGAD